MAELACFRSRFNAARAARSSGKVSCTAVMGPGGTARVAAAPLSAFWLPVGSAAVVALAAVDSDIVGGSYMLLCFLSEPKLVRVASLQQWTSPGTVCGAWKNRSFLLQMCAPHCIYIYIAQEPP